MNIKEVKRGMSGISVEAKVIDVSAPWRVRIRYGVRPVANINLEDETGRMKLSL